MCVEDLDDVSPAGAEADLGAGDALADVPVAAPKGGGAAV